MSDKEIKNGPVEDGPWPDRLSARVVTTEQPPRIWGYDVHSDLARHYSFTETVWLSLTGKLPVDTTHTRVLEVALSYLAPVTIAEAPAHAAGASQSCGSDAASVAGIGALTLAQQAKFVLDAHADLWPWLESATGSLPDALRSEPAEREQVDRLGRHLLDLGYRHAVFAAGPTLVAACLAVLHDLGLTREDQLLSAWVWCKLPCVLAEAYAVPRGRLGKYPMDVPRFRYEAPR